MRRALFAMFLVAVAVAGGGRLAYLRLLDTPSPAPAVAARVDVPPGEPFRVTAERLEDAGLVPSALAVRLWARWRGIDRQIQHGAYEFRDSLTPIAVVEKMRSGEAMVVRITLPEGLAVRDVAAALERANLGAAPEYLRLARDPAFARSVGVEADRLEGYLFPDTYFFSPLDRPEKILTAIVARFRQTFTPEMAAEAQAAGFTCHQIVTLASVIEKETGRDEERPLVAAVFRNRLRLGMPLQADPTVIYGIESFNGNLTRRDLATPSAYNTYQMTGLPPGPIANPGRLSLLAALRPAAVGYLYFVARADGSHEFSTTLSDHNRAVARHQKLRAPRSS